MITAQEAVGYANERPPRTIEPLPELSDRERMQLNYLDSMVETAIRKHFDGTMLTYTFPASLVELHIIQALRRRYESGGWVIGVRPRGSSDVVTEIDLTFALAPGTIEAKAPEKAPTELQPVPRHVVDAGEVPPRVLVRFPTRSRPAKALWALERYRNMAGMPVTIEVVIDSDDETMQTVEVRQRLAALGCITHSAMHRSKVEACNSGVVSDWDILVLASDDMIPVQDGYATRIVDEMKKAWPFYDGAIFFNDGAQGSNLCTLPILGRRLHDRFGYVYYPGYKSLFCDREQTDVLNQLGRLHYVDDIIIEHRHHAWGKAEKDQLYTTNDALESEDKALYEIRAAPTRDLQFQFDTMDIDFSICICTVPERKQKLNWLVDSLYRQIDHRANVEICIDDRKGISIGQKRQALLERSKGHYVAFVDDDDGVCDSYVHLILEALRINSGVDCLSLSGVLTTHGKHPERFEHSIEYTGWYTKDGVHYRTPNHLNAVRRELALQVGFVDKDFGEDKVYSDALRPLLKTEAKINEVVLYYYWYDPTK